MDAAALLPRHHTIHLVLVLRRRWTTACSFKATSCVGWHGLRRTAMKTAMCP